MGGDDVVVTYTVRVGVCRDHAPSQRCVSLPTSASLSSRFLRQYIGPGTYYCHAESLSHDTTYFPMPARMFESMFCRGSYIRVNVIIGIRTTLSGVVRIVFDLLPSEVFKYNNFLDIGR